MIKQQKIINVIIIDQFLNFISKIVENKNENLINVIVDIYNKEKKIYESNEKNAVAFKISTNKIIQILQLLQLYDEQQNKKNQDFITNMKKHFKFVNTRLIFKQTLITNYFT